MPRPRTFYLYIDPELRIVHSTRTCPAARVAVKYNTLESFKLATVGDARELDSRARPCDRCQKDEARRRGEGKTRSSRHVSPPGFRGEGN